MPVEAVQVYKELSEVERAFRQLRDAIGMRPIYHRNGQRVQGHIFVAALALLLQRALEKRLKAAGVNLSAQEALRTVLAVEVTAETERKLGVTGGRKRARQVLTALGITRLQPPPVAETT